MIVLTEAVDFYVFRRNNPLCHTETNPIENVVTVRFDDHLGIRVSNMTEKLSDIRLRCGT